MSLKGACDQLESAFADAEAKLDRVTEKVDASIAQANNPEQSSKPSNLLQNLKDIKAEHSTIGEISHTCFYFIFYI